MKVSEIKEVLEARPLVTGKEELNIKTVCGSDLMSDVLAFSQEKSLLLTGLTNPQVIRTAEMIEIKVIIFVRGKKPQSETIELAKKTNIFLYVTDKSMFESCGLLYESGLKPEKLEQI